MAHITPIIDGNFNDRDSGWITFILAFCGLCICLLFGFLLVAVIPEIATAREVSAAVFSGLMMLGGLVIMLTGVRGKWKHLFQKGIPLIDRLNHVYGYVSWE